MSSNGNLSDRGSGSPFQSGPTAKLKAIEINNFKSFKGTRYLPVKGKFISVVGPNGSGKNLTGDNCLGGVVTASVV